MPVFLSPSSPPTTSTIFLSNEMPFPHNSCPMFLTSPPFFPQHNLGTLVLQYSDALARPGYCGPIFGLHLNYFWLLSGKILGSWGRCPSDKWAAGNMELREFLGWGGMRGLQLPARGWSGGWGRWLPFFPSGNWGRKPGTRAGLRAAVLVRSLAPCCFLSPLLTVQSSREVPQSEASSSP